MRKFAHIINPVKVKETSDLFVAQPITFETMKRARDFAKGQVEVELFSAQFEEDHPVIPDYFKKLPDLEGSVTDVREFKVKRKYPLIKDILAPLSKSTDAEYFIFTNADIALMPQFYSAVDALIAKGHDALIINRRRVARKYASIEDIPLLYSDIGRPHPGFDCFVFHRDLFPRFILGNICVGVPFIGVSLAHNIWAFGKNYQLLSNHHLTIHIGLEVMPPRDKEYHEFNQGEFNKILKQIRPHLTPEKLPYSEMSFLKKIIRWGLNPSTFILLDMEIEAEGWWNKLKFLWNEVRFKWVSRE